MLFNGDAEAPAIKAAWFEVQISCETFSRLSRNSKNLKNFKKKKKKEKKKGNYL